MPEVSTPPTERALLVLMERATNCLDIPKDSRLSIDLQVGKEESVTPQSTRSRDVGNKTTAQHPQGNMTSLLPLPTFDLPVRQRPHDLSLEIPSTGKFDTEQGAVVFPWRRYRLTSADSGAVSKSGTSQAAKDNDCLLLDYQNQLYILEKLNQRTSRKTRKPR